MIVGKVWSLIFFNSFFSKNDINNKKSRFLKIITAMV